MQLILTAGAMSILSNFESYSLHTLQKYKDIRTATILTLVASSTFCGLLGFAVGRYLGGPDKRR